MMLAILVSLSFLWFGQAAHYRAAVVEYSPTVVFGQVTREEAVKVMQNNLDEYEKYVIAAKEQGASIIVFPEYGLYGPVSRTLFESYPYLEEIPLYSIPCDQFENTKGREITYAASCLAKKHGITVVLNMGDKVPCSHEEDCPPTGCYQYNTQVAFSDSGEVIGKYHKTHLYYEPQFNTPVNQKPQFFNTTFGVTFGMGICFDIIFDAPMQELVKQGITDFVFSSWWVNTPPFLTGNVMQASWSFYSNTNLLASSSGYTWHSSGSGIYHEGDVLTSFYNSNPAQNNLSKLLIADVPIKQRQEEQIIVNKEVSNREATPVKGSDMDYLPVPLDTAQGGSLSLSLETINCTLDYSVVSADPNARYFLFAYSGLWNLFNMSSCALIVCNSKDIHNCVLQAQEPIAASATFGENTTIRADIKTFWEGETSLKVFPITTVDDGALYSSWDYHTEEKEGGDLRHSSLSTSRAEKLVQLGFFGVRDWPKTTTTPTSF